MQKTTVIVLNLLVMHVCVMQGMEEDEKGRKSNNQLQPKTQLQYDVNTTKELFEEAHNIFTSGNISRDVLNFLSADNINSIDQIRSKLLKIHNESVLSGSERDYIDRSHCYLFGIAQNMELADQKNLVPQTIAKEIYGIYGRMDLIFMRTCGARSEKKTVSRRKFFQK